MENWLERTKVLLGQSNLDKLAQSHVLVVGLGGVGSYVAEHLTRSGVGELTIVDGDTVHQTNINRQIQALHSTVGKPKAHALAERLKDINPEIKLNIVDSFVKDQEMLNLLNNDYDYVVDAIDTLSPKVYLIYHALEKGHKLVSSMGTGGKKDPSQIQVADISKTHNDPLARILRKKLHRLGIYSGFKAVFSPEPVSPESLLFVSEQNKKTTLGTISYIPATFGAFCAYVVINDITK